MVKDVIRDIKGRWLQFVAILLITALGVGFYIGIQVTGYDMRFTADQYMKTSNALDLEVRHTLGIDVEMLDSLNGITGSKGRGVYDTDAYIHLSNRDGVARVIEFTDATSNDVLISEGTVPKNNNEVFVDEQLINKFQLKIGDTIVLKDNDIFEEIELTIVGFGKSNLYMNLERGSTTLGTGEVNGFIYPKGLQHKHEVFTAVRFEGVNVSEAKDVIGNNEETLSNERFERIVANDRQKLADAQSELNTQKAKILQQFTQAENALKEANQKLKDASHELASGIQEITSQLGINISGMSYQAQLDNVKLHVTEFKNTNTKLVDGELAKATVMLEELQTNYEAIAKQIEITTDVSLLEQLTIQQKEMEVQIQTVEAQVTMLTEKQSELTAEFKVVDDGVNTLQAGIDYYNEANQLYKENMQKLQTNRNIALTKINQSQSEIDEGIATIDSTSHGKIYSFERKDVLVGYTEFYQDSDRIEAIGKVFPLIFFGVSVLVTLSTISRMIDESRSQIGVYKALGYSSWYASLKYIYFALFSWAGGVLIGVAIGFYMIPSLIYNAYRIMYQTPDLITQFVMSYALLPLIISFLCSVGIAGYKALKVSRQRTANLLRPEAPKKGQRIILERIPFIWNRMSFLYKVSFRNLFRNKSRFLMTILGIGGCAGLLITAFGLQHSIYSIIDKQFGEVIHYDGTVLHNDATIDTSLFTQSINIASVGGKYEGNDIQVMISSPEDDISPFISLQSRVTKEKLNLDDNSIIISEKLAILGGLEVGNTMMLDLNGQDVSVLIGGITENYVMHYVYMSRNLYTEKTGESTHDTITFFNTDTDNQALATQILENKDVYSISFMDNVSDAYSDMMKNFDIVIYVIMGAAFILELIVLLNLISMNLSERTKELATIKVLGFYPKEVAQYVLRENIILTFISMVFGLGFGVVLHRYVILKAELNFVMFNRELLVSSVATAIAITILLSLIINFLMSRKANDVNMREALKTFDE